jgi:hypothetical protein
MDFTIKTYHALLYNLQRQGFEFSTFEDFAEKKTNTRSVILRHDVDLLPYNSLDTARIENSLGIRGSYYFRIGTESNNPTVIHQIELLGHEIGYHYETMDEISKKLHSSGHENMIDEAYEEFCKNLAYFRTLYPVKTICMHGSPRSKYDNRAIWQKYDYRKLGIIGEPYFDIDFSKVFYLTDTGRRWDGYKVSVRDKIPDHQERWTKEGLVFHSTKDIIRAARENCLPDQIMITVHPQRWTNHPGLWMKELVFQELKNVVKRNMLAQ